MKIGMNVPPHMASAENLFTWVKRIQAGPFTTLSVLDRIVYPNFEPLITLAAAAALTNRVRLMTEVLISPIRNILPYLRRKAQPWIAFPMGV